MRITLLLAAPLLTPTACAAAYTYCSRYCLPGTLLLKLLILRYCSFVLLLVLLLLRDCFYATAFTLLLTRYLVCNTYCPTDYAILLTLLLTQYFLFLCYPLHCYLPGTQHSICYRLRYCLYATAFTLLLHTRYLVPGTSMFLLTLLPTLLPSARRRVIRFSYFRKAMIDQC